MKLAADCERCSGLCCVAPAFCASVDFGFDMPAGLPCPYLLPSFRCGIHTHLRSDGMRGCAAYDCFGAGQQVSQVTFAGADRRTVPHLAGQMFQTFAVMRQLHELLWYLTAVLAMPASSALRHQVHLARETIEQLTMLDADSLAALDVDAHRNEANAGQRARTCRRRARSAGPPRGRPHRREPSSRRPHWSQPARRTADWRRSDRGRRSDSVCERTDHGNARGARQQPTRQRAHPSAGSSSCRATS